MAVNLALFEHATGYGLFKVKEFEEIGAFTQEVEASIIDVSKFNGIVSLLAFLPFKTAADALNNINSISEGIPTPELKLFLQTSFPKKAKKCVMGVLDSKLGGSLADELGIKVSHIGVVPEIIRGIRTHFFKLVKGLDSESSGKAQLGLGHAYSRAKVKFNVHKADNMIIQSIALLDQLDKDINTFSMRIREWYSYHFPELYKIVADNYTFCQCVGIIKNRKELASDISDQLEDVLKDSGKAKAIIDASKSSMGMDISPLDLMHINRFAERVMSLANYRKQLMDYLKTKMGAVAPNLCTLIGETVGARLISHAGSLTNLAKCPASTVQILGAEKALFRALKTKGNTPKYGLIFHSSFIGRASAKNKGRISRYLANKCSIASRIDCFTENPTQIFGTMLKQQVEDRLIFYDSGDLPRKNIDVMNDAVSAVAAEVASFNMVKPKTKKSKKRKAEELLEDSEVPKEENNVDLLTTQIHSVGLDAIDGMTPVRKKKKKLEVTSSGDQPTIPVVDEGSSNVEVDNSGISSHKKKKKKKNEIPEENGDTCAVNGNAGDDSVHNESQMDVTGENENLSASAKKKKKKKSKDVAE